MNTHLKIFNNYKENASALENNLTRAFILTLLKEPQLLRDFLNLVSNDVSWDDIEADIQASNAELSGIEKIIGLAITVSPINKEAIENTVARDTKNPIPDFLIYDSRTLIVGEVKKTGEVPIAQVKNQVQAMLAKLALGEKKPVVEIKAITWMEILSKLVLPYETYLQKKGIAPYWASEFREYITFNYPDWLPVLNLDQIPANKTEEVNNKRFIEKRLYEIQCKTSFGEPEYWIGGRMTLNLKFAWATEAMVSMHKDGTGVYVCLTMWPANTKTQGNYVFNKNINWATTTQLNVGDYSFEIENLPCVKFSHVMGKFVADYYFKHATDISGKPILSKENFYKISHRWNREDWPEFIKAMDELCDNELDWKAEMAWSEKFENSGRNFVFTSLGAETNIYIPYQTFQKLEKDDPTGKAAAQLLELTIEAFRRVMEN